MTTAVIAVFLTILVYSSGSGYEMCMRGNNYGIRRQSYCHVNLKRSIDSRTLVFEEAVEYCTANSGFVNNLFAPISEKMSMHSFLMSRLANYSDVYADDWTYSYSTEVPGPECLQRPTTAPGCGVFCAFETCPLGTFGLPHCSSSCHCSDRERCDILDGSCIGTSCEPGYFHPGACREKCRCKLNVTCDQLTGECPGGCGLGWKGKSCQERSCENGECRGKRRAASCNPGWSGVDCTKRMCPRGSYGPPACNSTCYCMFPQFCEVIDGDCKKTPCTKNRSGPKCQDYTCPPTHFGIPSCSNLCFCRGGEPCDTRNGTCPRGCKDGWKGANCNERSCPIGFFGYPKCESVCKCKTLIACNSLTGMCETELCENGTKQGFDCIGTEKYALEKQDKEAKATWKIGATLVSVFFVTAAMVVVLNAFVAKRRGRRGALIVDTGSNPTLNDVVSRPKIQKSGTSFAHSEHHGSSIKHHGAVKMSINPDYVSFYNQSHETRKDKIISTNIDTAEVHISLSKHPPMPSTGVTEG